MAPAARVALESKRPVAPGTLRYAYPEYLLTYLGSLDWARRPVHLYGSFAATFSLRPSNFIQLHGFGIPPYHSHSFRLIFVTLINSPNTLIRHDLLGLHNPASHSFRSRQTGIRSKDSWGN